MNVQMGVSAKLMSAKNVRFLMKIKLKRGFMTLLARGIKKKKRYPGLIPLDFLKLLTSPSVHSLFWESSRCCLLANSIQN